MLVMRLMGNRRPMWLLGNLGEAKVLGSRPLRGHCCPGWCSWTSQELGSAVLLERPVPFAELGYLVGLGYLDLSPQWKVLAFAIDWGQHAERELLFCQKDPLD